MGLSVRRVCSDGLLQHEACSRFRNGSVVGDDNHAVVVIGWRAIEDDNRDIIGSRFLDYGHRAFAILRNQYDPIDALSDAVTHLLELSVHILIGIALDNTVAHLS